MARALVVTVAGLVGLLGGACLGLTARLADPDNRRVLRREFEHARLRCSTFGEQRSEPGDRDRPPSEFQCVPVATRALLPGQVVTPDDLDGVWLPRDYVLDEQVRSDPSGRVVTRRVLPGDWLREERLGR
ncbi:MAG: SAF domain-containing protein [Myxococcota bacterium]